MINPNEIDGYNDSLSTENNKNIEYTISFPENLVGKINKFIERFQISYDILINKLLSYHFYDLKSEVESEDYELLPYYYFCFDEIFNNSENNTCDSLNKAEMKIKNISVKIGHKYHTVIKEISEEIHYTPEVFIRKAIQWQWNIIGDDLVAGDYYIIEDFCNISKIKKFLKDLFEKKEDKD